MAKILDSTSLLHTLSGMIKNIVIKTRFHFCLLVLLGRASGQTVVPIETSTGIDAVTERPLPISADYARPLVKPGNGIAIGIEYALINNQRAAANHAKVFGDLGVPAVKHYAGHVQWGEMQRSPDAPIDFTRLDAFVREYQANGFSVLTICLKPHSPWASIDPGLGRRMINARNASPKLVYMEHFERWIEAVVRRYNMDGVDDMPGLRAPITYLEIGSEFSSYQPEPVEVYLHTLERAYKAAKRAAPNIKVAHAAFLTTPVDLSRVTHPGQYESVFAAEQGIEVINLSFTTDLPLLTGRLGRAGAGISAWGGMVRHNFRHEVQERYPNFYSIQQMGRHLNAYDSIKRLDMRDDSLRVYEINRRGDTYWVAWLNPKKILLPGDSAPTIDLTLTTGGTHAVIEPVITRIGQTTPDQKKIETPKGKATLTLSTHPVYIFAGNGA